MERFVVSVFNSVDKFFSAAIALEVSADNALETVVILPSTKDLTDFTVGYFTSEFASVRTFVLLFNKFSFVASAAVALLISVSKLLVNVASAAVALVTSAASATAPLEKLSST